MVEADSLRQDPPRLSYAEPTIFAAAIDEPRRRSGLGVWFAAAASLVLGIVIGFASGYRAGQGSSSVPAAVESPAPTSGSASQGKPFTESSVPDPVRVDPQEIVPAPPVGRTLSGPPGAPDPSTSSGSPRAESRGDKARPTMAPPGAPDRGVPAAPAPRVGVVRPARPALVEEKPPLTGPASLQVVSRPAGAEVIVDGKSVGRTPLSMEMTPGSHDVRLALAGFKGWATTVDVKPGITTRVSGSLEQ